MSPCASALSVASLDSDSSIFDLNGSARSSDRSFSRAFDTSPVEREGGWCMVAPIIRVSGLRAW